MKEVLKTTLMHREISTFKTFNCLAKPVRGHSMCLKLSFMEKGSRTIITRNQNQSEIIEVLSGRLFRKEPLFKSCLLDGVKCHCQTWNAECTLTLGTVQECDTWARVKE